MGVLYFFEFFETYYFLRHTIICVLGSDEDLALMAEDY